MTNTELKTLAEEAKRFDGGDWYLFQHLIDHWSMDKQDAAYIAAVSPDVVLGLLAEVERLKDALDCDRAILKARTESRDALQAKLSAMEKQEPVAVALRFAGDERLCLSTVFDTREEAQHYADTCAKSKAVTVPLYAAPKVAQQPLSDEQAKKLCDCGLVYAPNGKVERDPISYRRELQNAMLLGLRKGEAAHNIGGQQP